MNIRERLDNSTIKLLLAELAVDNAKIANIANYYTKKLQPISDDKTGHFGPFGVT